MRIRAEHLHKIGLSSATVYTVRTVDLGLRFPISLDIGKALGFPVCAAEVDKQAKEKTT